MIYIERFFLSLIFLLGMFGCSKPPKPKQMPNVHVSKVEQRDVPIYIDAIGQAIATVSVDVKPQVAGKLIATYIKQGDIVKAGDIIYQIDPRPYQAILDEANAQLQHDLATLNIAQKTVDSYKHIVEDDFIAKLTFENYIANVDTARGQVESDRASIRAAALNVDFCNIVAPVSGKISYFVVDVGNIVAVDDPTAITSIKPFDPIDIEFSLPQQQLELIRPVQGNEGKWKFIAVLPEHPNKKINGTTFFIDNQVNQDTGTIFLKGRLENADWDFWPGEFVKVQVLYRIAENALVVPPGAVLMGKNGAYIYTMDAENKVSAHDVTVLISTNEYIAFEAKDITEGTSVITDGQINIAPGMKVQVVEPKTDEQKKAASTATKAST